LLGGAVILALDRNTDAILHREALIIAEAASANIRALRSVYTEHVTQPMAQSTPEAAQMLPLPAGDGQGVDDLAADQRLEHQPQ
jgi:hypothetical protein